MYLEVPFGQCSADTTVGSAFSEEKEGEKVSPGEKPWWAYEDATFNFPRKKIT